MVPRARHVAAGVPPGGPELRMDEPAGSLPERSQVRSVVSGRRDAVLYGRRDACRYNLRARYAPRPSRQMGVDSLLTKGGMVLKLWCSGSSTFLQRGSPPPPPCRLL